MKELGKGLATLGVWVAVALIGMQGGDAIWAAIPISFLAMLATLAIWF